MMNNKSNAAILDFDDIFGMALPVEKSKSKQTSKRRINIADNQRFKSATPIRKISKKAKSNVETNINSIIKRSSDSEETKLRSAIDSLTSHANFNIVKEITNSNEYISLMNKVAQCKVNIEKFTKVNDVEEVQHWKNELKKYRDELSIYKEMMSVHSVRSSVNDLRIFRSVKSQKLTPEVLAAQYKIDVIKAEMKRNSPSYIVSELKELREQMNLRDLYTNDNHIPDFDELLESENNGFNGFYLEEEIDEEIPETIIENVEENSAELESCPNRILVSKYNKLCNYIADKLDCTPDEISEMKLGTILSYLKEKSNVKDEELIERLNNAQIELMNARSNQSKIDSNYGICEFIYDNYDLSNPEDEKKVRELLASIYVRIVKGIAYNIVSKRNKLHMYEEAVGYGLLGLTMAINKWIARQKSEPKVVIEFKGICNNFVANAIKSGFVELTSLGTASVSHIQHKAIDMNKRIENFIRYNPEYKNTEKEELVKMLSDEDTFVGSVNFMYESTYDDISKSKSNSADSSELWDIVTRSKYSLETYTESKNDYQLLIRSIKQLLNLFETEKDSVTGLTFESGRKLFDRYETRLFEMTFGFAWKKNSNSTGNSQYTQSEMGEELRKMYAEQGINKTFSQPAITSRINTLKKKIQFAVENNKKLKRAFEYIKRRWEENPEYMLLISNEHEQIGESFCPPPKIIFKKIEEKHEMLKNVFEESPLNYININNESKALNVFNPTEING